MLVPPLQLESSRMSTPKAAPFKRPDRSRKALPVQPQSVTQKTATLDSLTGPAEPNAAAYSNEAITGLRVAVAPAALEEVLQTVIDSGDLSKHPSRPFAASHDVDGRHPIHRTRRGRGRSQPLPDATQEVETTPLEPSDRPIVTSAISDGPEDDDIYQSLGAVPEEDDNVDDDIDAATRLPRHFVHPADMVFRSTASEILRTYHYPDGGTETIVAPLHLHVSASGGHRILDASNTSHYIAPGWRRISWQTKPGHPQFDF